MTAIGIFFMIWKNRVPLKPLYLIIITHVTDNLDTNNENMEILLIEKYTKLGVIKRFNLQILMIQLKKITNMIRLLLDF